MVIFVRKWAFGLLTATVTELLIKNFGLRGLKGDTYITTTKMRPIGSFKVKKQGYSDILKIA